FLFSTWPRSPPAVSSRGEVAVIVMLSLGAPISSLRSTATSVAVETRMPARSSFFKPGCPTTILYLPGTTNGNPYAPVSFEVVCSATLVATLNASTIAPGTAAPLGSVMRPEIVPRDSWANAAAANANGISQSIDLRQLQLITTPHSH